MHNTKIFTINDLERFSGVKAHTLRIWERRYALLQPSRSPGNFRLYTLDELKKILNIALLKKNGYSVSGLSKFSDTVIEHKAENLPNDYNKWQKAINDLTISMYTKELESFEWLLDELLLKWPIEILVEKIIFPFLKITNLLWTGNKLFEEHLVVTASRKKLILAIESINTNIKKEKTVLLFLPDCKQLDLGLLYSNFNLKRKGIHVLYLGNDVTIDNLKIILQVQPPAYIFTYLHQNHHFQVEQLLDLMETYIPAAKLIIGNYSNEHKVAMLNDNVVRMDYADALVFLHTCCL